MRDDDDAVDNAKTAAPFVEVIFVKTRKLIGTIGTLVIVGAASTAGAALWTNVLEDKMKLAKARKTHSESDKVIVVDFRKARRESGR